MGETKLTDEATRVWVVIRAEEGYVSERVGVYPVGVFADEQTAREYAKRRERGDGGDYDYKVRRFALFDHVPTKKEEATIRREEWRILTTARM